MTRRSRNVTADLISNESIDAIYIRGFPDSTTQKISLLDKGKSTEHKNTTKGKKQLIIENIWKSIKNLVKMRAEESTLHLYDKRNVEKLDEVD